VIDLPLDLEQVGRPRIEEPVGIETLRASEFVDEISDADGLVRREHFDVAGIEDALRLLAGNVDGKESGDVAEQAEADQAAVAWVHALFLLGYVPIAFRWSLT